MLRRGMMASSGAGPGGPGVFLAAAHAVDQSSGVATLAVPGSPAAGDYLLAFLQCRGDRSFTVPGGWTVIEDTGAASSSDMRMYILQKAWASETSVSFTQSVTAAYGFSLTLISKPIGAYSFAENVTGTSITKVSGASDVLQAAMFNNSPDIPAHHATYTGQGASYFTNVNYFYGSAIATLSGAAAGSVGGSASSSASQIAIFLAEIGS